MCACVSMYVSKALWSCASHPNTTHRIPDIPVGRNYSTLGMLTNPLLAYGGQMIGTNWGTRNRALMSATAHERDRRLG